MHFNDDKMKYIHFDRPMWPKYNTLISYLSSIMSSCLNVATFKSIFTMLAPYITKILIRFTIACFSIRIRPPASLFNNAWQHSWLKGEHVNDGYTHDGNTDCYKEKNVPNNRLLIAGTTTVDVVKKHDLVTPVVYVQTCNF